MVEPSSSESLQNDRSIFSRSGENVSWRMMMRTLDLSRGSDNPAPHCTPPAPGRGEIGSPPPERKS